jgi:phosphopantothenoylcysteine decarboxylase/phosphopantothenate--cysteine ligase
MHPSKDLYCVKSEKLKGKRIVLALTGSIAACETIKLARELIRHGAGVIPVMSEEAQKIMHPNALEFATGNKPIIEVTGKVTYISLCGQRKGRADLLLIAPATANTISKIALGMADTPVTTFATTAIGSKMHVLVVPAMHGSMYQHPQLIENIKRCKQMGIKFIHPMIEEGTAKLAGKEEIVARVIREIGERDLTDKKVLIIGGNTQEAIDSIRVITNRSSGKMAIELTRAAYERGATIELWYGRGTVAPPKWINTTRFETSADLIRLVKQASKFDLILDCAAVIDYKPHKIQGKIPSNKEVLTLKFERLPKIIDLIRRETPNAILVGFKAEEKELVKSAKEKLKEVGMDFVVANPLSAFGSEETEIKIINKEGKIWEAKGKKSELAEVIFDVIKGKEKNS